MDAARGGFYFWCRFPDGIRQSQLLAKAAELRVSYLPGDACVAGEPGANHLRLNFTFAPPGQIRDGVARLMEALRVAVRRPQAGKPEGAATSPSFDGTVLEVRAGLARHGGFHGGPVLATDNEVRASEIREILKLTQRPEVISFAGGLPAPSRSRSRSSRRSRRACSTSAAAKRSSTPPPRDTRAARWVADHMNETLATTVNATRC